VITRERACFMRSSPTARSYEATADSRSFFCKHRCAMCTWAVSHSGSTSTALRHSAMAPSRSWPGLGLGVGVGVGAGLGVRGEGEGLG